MSDLENKKKGANDILKVTLTCNISSYDIKTVNKKTNNEEMRICNVNAYVITTQGLKNMRLVIYNERYINLFEKYPQKGNKILVFGKLNLRSYEKEGMKIEIFEIVIGDSDELSVIRRKRIETENTTETSSAKSYNVSEITNNSKYNNNNKSIDELDEFNFDEFLNDNE